MLKLTEEKQARLVALRRSPGWDDWLDIGEQLCQIEETSLLRMDRAAGATAEQILSKQDQCRGFRLFFETWQREVLEQEKRMLDEMQPAPGAAPLAESTRGKAEPVGPLEVLEVADALGLLSGGIGIGEEA